MLEVKAFIVFFMVRISLDFRLPHFVIVIQQLEVFDLPKSKKELVFAEMLTVVMLIQKHGVVNYTPFFFQINRLTNFLLIEFNFSEKGF